ncbi:MipA/OmpV family protein [Croceicoccus hydrothermalis]|uniref:MipA/OmpV family protein n=1 Tax=Croceicoccus hydrothermalis TaxID=2867964 RepID=UPI001EFBF938|nr:MipA/OmpV family protein [Croceicoccus hydrothermalis]
MVKCRIWPVLIMAGTIIPVAAQAQDADEFEQVRIGIGPQFQPAYPGADGARVGPFFDIDRRAEGEDFAFEAPTESFGFPLIEFDGLYLGPTASITNSRKQEDTAPGLRTIGTTVEAGIAAQLYISENIYSFVELRRGIGGHDGWTGQAGLDYIVRDADRYVVSAGPRVTYGDSTHSQAYFGITPEESAASGFAAYDADGGLQSAGGVVSVDFALGGPWGVMGFGGYQRLVGDAADSPVVELFGSKDQWTGGIAVNYTFRRRRDGLF